ncbi:MAG: GGDEF domain-containing protein [Burkholderiaceae bacterium]|nr:GGDEF domain-containing protein [Burkholderiaceae bacterium]
MTSPPFDLADLPGQRERDRVDLSVAELVGDLVAPADVSIARRVGIGSNPRWKLVRPAAGAAVVCKGALERIDAATLERLGRGDIIHRGSGPFSTLVPLLIGTRLCALVETVSSAAPDARTLGILLGVQRYYRRMRELHDESERDAMTGLRNRRSFDAHFDDAALEPRPGGSGRGFWLGIVDADHFKQINDRFGHLIGDEILILLAHLMRAALDDADDSVYRFGGEEFVVLMHGLDENEAARRFEAVRASIEAFEFPQVGRITVSIGFTRVRFGEPSSQALHRADIAVYHAKATGRNAAHGYDDLMDKGSVRDDGPANCVEFF